MHFFHLGKQSILFSQLTSKSILDWWFSWSVAVIIPGLPTAILQGILFYFSPSFLASEIPFLELLFHLRKVHLPGASSILRCHPVFFMRYWMPYWFQVLWKLSPTLLCPLPLNSGKLTGISLYPYVLKFHYTVPWHGSFFHLLSWVPSGFFQDGQSCPSVLGTFLAFFPWKISLPLFSHCDIPTIQDLGLVL